MICSDFLACNLKNGMKLHIYLKCDYYDKQKNYKVIFGGTQKLIRVSLGHPKIWSRVSLRNLTRVSILCLASNHTFHTSPLILKCPKLVFEVQVGNYSYILMLKF